jgi:TonB family protein
VLRSTLSALLGCGVLLICITGPGAYAHETGQLELPKLRTSDPTPNLYPPAARRLGVQGRVLVEFTISLQGRVSSSPTVLLAEETEGHVILEAAACRTLAMRSSTFRVIGRHLADSPQVPLQLCVSPSTVPGSRAMRGTSAILRRGPRVHHHCSAPGCTNTGCLLKLAGRSC